MALKSTLYFFCCVFFIHLDLIGAGVGGLKKGDVISVMELMDLTAND